MLDECREPGWGHESVQLRLPASRIAFTGLSPGQRSAIVCDYGAFLEDRAESEGTPDVQCQAGRLPARLALAPELLTHAGQYAPLKRREGDLLAITGENFTAQIRLNMPAPMAAVLSVADEQDLPLATVLENFLRILLAHRVLGAGGLLLHSAGLVVDGRAFLFAGHSNVGKTTLARKAAAVGVRVLSDDINLVLPQGDGFCAHAVPFTGEFGRRAESGAKAVPLAAIVLLEQGPRLTVSGIEAAQAVAGLFAGCPFVNSDALETPRLLESLARLVESVPVARLSVAPEDRFPSIMNRLREVHGHR